MAALDLEEQEQVAELKAWWARYGNLVLTAVIIICLVITGYFGYRYYTRGQSNDAAAIYEQLQTYSAAKDKAKSAELAGQLLERFPRTVFAPMAALVNAKVLFEAGDLKGAKAQLQWVLDKSKEDDLKHIARVRLAGVLIDEKSEAAYAEALKLMETSRPAFYDPLYGDRKGDVLMAQGKTADARAAWEDAYLKADERNPIRSILQLKIELAGGSAPARPKS